MKRKYIPGPYIPTHYDKEDAKIMKNLRREDEMNRKKTARYQPPKNIPTIKEKKSWWPF